MLRLSGVDYGTVAVIASITTVVGGILKEILDELIKAVRRLRASRRQQ